MKLGVFSKISFFIKVSQTDPFIFCSFIFETFWIIFLPDIITLRMALYLFEHDIDFFNTISVIVTGPYRWLRPHSKFTHLPNVHVYFSGYKDEIDAFASQNTLDHYVPYTVVTLEHTYMSDLQPSVFIKRDYAEPFHHLQFYRQLMGGMIGGTKKYHNKRRKSKTNPVYKRCRFIFPSSSYSIMYILRKYLKSFFVLLLVYH